MTFLGIDSSGTAASVAVVKDGAVLGEFFVNNKLTHSQTLMQMAQDLLDVVNIKTDEITAFAVSSGPGSFTGVRIGIAAVKGMAFGADKMCIPVSALEAAAYNFRGEDITVSVCFDARCGQVYNAIFRVKGDSVERITEDRAISAEAVARELSTYRNAVLCGDGAGIVGGFAPDIPISPAEKRYQKASGVCFLATRSLDKGINAEGLVPSYLRPPQAERMRREQSK